MIYKHLPLVQIPPCVREDRSDGRVYITPDGLVYPSVTTVLGVGDNSWLDDWIAKVGKTEADIISARASARGTRIHKFCEDTLNNTPSEPGIFDREIFESFKKSLPYIDNIRGIEQRLYSDILKVAGTVDLVADFKGIISIIDWKTSRRVKYRDDISGYFAQCAAYALAYEERTGIKVPQIVIIMGVDDEPEPLIFVEQTKDWVPEFIKQRKIFRLIKGF